MSSQQHVTKAAGVVSFATVITRVLGYLRDMVIATAFGAGMEADAFFVAFRIPNMLRRFLGEGALTVTFIPVFVEECHQSEERAWTVANITLTLLIFILFAVTAFGIMFTPALISVIAPGFDDIPSKFDLTVSLTRVCFPYIFFISLAALATGVLNSLQHFFSPALAPAMLNLTMIAAAFWISPHVNPPVLGLAIGVVFGGMMQWLFQVPSMTKRGFRFRLNFDYKNPAVRKIGALLLPALFGLAIHQITVFVNTLLASFLQEGSVSYLYYSNRVLEFPLGVFCMPVATAVLPTMSAQAAKGEHDQFLDTLSFALRLVMFITIPAMIGLIVLRVPITALLFEHGRFSAADTLATAQALMFYTLGLWAIAASRIIVPVFYSLKDTKTPVKCAAAALAFSTASSLILMKPMQYNGLALASTLAAACNLILLTRALRKKLGRIGWRKIGISTAKASAASVVMGVCCWPFISVAHTHSWALLPAIAVGAASFFVSAHLLKSDELTFLSGMVTQKLARLKKHT